jgi:hypothetical protein
MKLAILWLSISVSTWAQAQTPSVHQETPGPCSVAVAGNNNQVFTCQGFDDKTAKQILQIVNRIAVKQLDPALVMEKLDEIQKSLGEIQKANSQRHRGIPPEFRQAFIAQLSKTTASIEVLAFVYDKEANDFAQELFGDLHAAGLNPGGVTEVMPGPNPLNGVTVEYHGETPAAGQLVNVGGDTPEGNVVAALMNAKVKGIYVRPDPNIAAGSIKILVSSNPMQ